jgi:hypothetical protein
VPCQIQNNHFRNENKRLIPQTHQPAELLLKPSNAKSSGLPVTIAVRSKNHKNESEDPNRPSPPSGFIVRFRGRYFDSTPTT